MNVKYFEAAEVIFLVSGKIESMDSTIVYHILHEDFPNIFNNKTISRQQKINN